ncbi:hypothetical protein HYALB_00013902 [Hymenoscyphus albidus]|uniref:Protein kinase domain-containing protein n=1 Tax=Hymenoscyphus albidus TaxID=595503 RepID=A0A9N9M2V2_9HELO|nr:hypothetical protein HYALB_00013902 [Hymenoscyphus albidus]
MLRCGVEHHDVRPPNVLWNSETSNVVLVDFERSEILEQFSISAERSPNWKRKHPHSHDKISSRGGQTSYHQVWADILDEDAGNDTLIIEILEHNDITISVM